MSKQKNRENNDLVFTFSDFYSLCKRAKAKILISALLGGVLLAGYSLTKPIQYSAQGTFKDKGTARGAISAMGSLGIALMNGFTDMSENEAISTMKSRKLMSQLIKQLDMQANLFRKEPSSRVKSFVANTLGIDPHTIGDNLRVEKAYFDRSQVPVLPDGQPVLSVVDIVYEEEVPLTLLIKFTSDNTYEIEQIGGQKLGEGKVGIPFCDDICYFTIIRNKPASLADSEYILSLSPMTTVSKALASQITIESDRMDRSLLKFSYKHKDRHFACRCINTLMTLYQNHLRKEHQKTITEQLAYLRRRQTEVTENIRNIMDEHAQNLMADFSTIGFLDSERAMNFLAANQQSFKHKQMTIDLDIKRMEKALEEGYAYYEGNSSSGDPMIINNLLAQMRDLQQQYDSIDIDLKNATYDKDTTHHHVFADQMEDLDATRKMLAHIDKLQHAMEEDRNPEIAEVLLNSPKTLIAQWNDKLAETYAGWQKAPQDEKPARREAWLDMKARFGSYLGNMAHFYSVRKKSLEEALANQQNVNHDFRGINIPLAKELYIVYTRELNDIQAQILQLKFVIGELSRPDFELTSLSPVITDPIAREMISKASHSTLQLHDQNNRTPREQERLKEELEVQKRFLDLHLSKSLELLLIREELIKDKIVALQNATLVLLKQQIAILEKQLTDYIASRIENLQLENYLLEKQQQELRKEMSVLPEKMVTEKLIEQQVAMNQQMGRDITNLVESKNITNNLEVIQSAPVDIALPPILPEPARLAFHFVFGLLLGAFLSISYFLGRSVIRGIPATVENLKAAHVDVAGRVSAKFYTDGAVEESDLATLRRLISHLGDTYGREKGSTLLVMHERGFDFSGLLCRLMAKKGNRVLHLPLTFSGPSGLKDKRDLVSYVERNAGEPYIEKGFEFDRVECGGPTQYGNEIVTSKPFKELLGKWSSEYDWIVLSTDAKPTSVEAESMVGIFDNFAIALENERLQDLAYYIGKAKTAEDGRKFCFILV